MKIKVTKEAALDLLEYSVIEDKIIGTSRWSLHHKAIVQLGDKYYQAQYRVGATEYQDESPWEHDTEVELIEVHQVEKTIKVWEPV